MDLATIEEDWSEDGAHLRLFELFASKWTSTVLHTLHTRHGGMARTCALYRSLPNISRRMVVQTLRTMERSGLVSRQQSAVPRAVEYRLTLLGTRLVQPVELLYVWGRDNAGALHPLDSSRSPSDQRL